MVDENTIWLGSSGGALIAAAAALELDLEHQLKFCISTGIESSERHALGPVGKMSHYIAQHIRESMPDDAHKKTAGRLFISITETPQGARLYGNALVGNFKSRQHLYHVLMASSYIPMYYEVPPRPGIGAFYWDGGFSNNQPVLKGADGQILSTTISASSRRADICPSTQDTCNIEHLFPNKYETCMRIHQRGRRDALSYIRKLRASRKCKASGNA